MEKIIEYMKKNKFLLIGNVVLFLLVLTGFWLVSKSPESTDEDMGDIFLTTQSSTQEISEVIEDERMFVDVKGEVVKPGIYEADQTMRVNDLIQMAGGFTENAETKTVNLSQRLSDEMVIYVAKIGEEVLESTMPEVATSDNAKVNINTADASQLQTLSGVGQKRAEDIIQYREQNGSFKSVDELKNVSGFGEKTLEKLRDFITVK